MEGSVCGSKEYALGDTDEGYREKRERKMMMIGS